MMSPELDEQLCKRYPLIFENRHASMQETCMCWGLEVGDGWYNILDQLCANIQWHIDGTKKSRVTALEYNFVQQQARLGNWDPFDKYYDYISTPDQIRRYKDDILKSGDRTVPALVEQVIATQVKEKFGTLRFYYSGGDETISGMLYMAESMTEVTCEVCGAPGKRNDSGWLSVRCEAHRQK
jgi:hypothetical protein